MRLINVRLWIVMQVIILLIVELRRIVRVPRPVFCQHQLFYGNESQRIATCLVLQQFLRRITARGIGSVFGNVNQHVWLLEIHLRGGENPQRFRNQCKMDSLATQLLGQSRVRSGIALYSTDEPIIQSSLHIHVLER